MSEFSSNKLIARNTAYMYMRMLSTMIVSLYTSRVVLHVLGEVDFGTYSIVGGVVVFFTFISNAMATGTQRHLSFELGKKNGHIATVFSACLRIQLWLALIILVLAETIGLWFLNYKMNFPEGRMEVINWVYQFSVLSCIIGIVQTVFTAAIISYERMSFYAYLSIIEVMMKLGIVFLLQIILYDKLFVYGGLVLVVSILIFCIYLWYSLNKLQNIKIVRIKDTSIYKRLISFSGWSLFGSLSNVGYQQGINIIINLFFGVTLNAAVGIANQINSAVSQFVTGFQQALNPQLVQAEAANDKSRQLDLIYKSSKFSYYIVFIIAYPLLLNIDCVLSLWLGQYPAHTSALCALIIAGLLVSCISGPLWVSIYATGKIKYYQIIVSVIALSILPIAYLMGQYGADPESIFIVRASNFIFVLIAQLFFLRSYILLDVRGFIKSVIIPVIGISGIALLFYFILRKVMTPAETFWVLVYQTIIYVSVVILLIWAIGITKIERKQLVTIVLSRINKK